MSNNNQYDDPYLSDKRFRTGLRFLGNSPELDEEFRRMLAGLPPEVRTNESLPSTQEEGENISGFEVKTGQGEQ
jgi:hypothetical protein